MSHRGFVQARTVLYPQESGSDARQALAEATARYEPTVRLAPWLRILGGIEVAADSWNQVDRRARLDVRDRGILRPAWSVRRLTASLNYRGLTIDAGKQFVRWGKTDVLGPTDRFAPRDYLEVTDNDFLAVTGVRLRYEKASNTLDAMWVPWLTPSRLPLLDTRWAPVPHSPGAPPVTWASSKFPTRSQMGLRWNHVGEVWEFSASLYDGFNHLPIVGAQTRADPLRAELVRIYPRLRMYGGDVALPLRLFTLQGEAGYFTSSDRQADDYLLYVLQLERQRGEWSFVVGYAGEVIAKRRAALDVSPDRGLARAVIGRAAYTIDPNRNLALEGAARQDGSGTWARGEYSQAVGAHWRATIGATLIAGRDDDFLGQYHRNSHVSLSLRYSF